MVARIVSAFFATSLLVAGGANAQAPAAPKSKTVSFAGVEITLPIPEGYCEIPRDTPDGKDFWEVQEKANAGSNRVALMMADCKEWEQRVGHPEYRLRRFANYLFPVPDGEHRYEDLSREQFIEAMAGVEIDGKEIKADADKRMSEVDETTGKVQTVDYQPRVRDKQAIYLLSTMQVQYPDETPTLCLVQGMTLVKHAPLVLNAYNDFHGKADMDALLAEQKRSLGLLVQAND